MQKLNLPDYLFRIRSDQGNVLIFDGFRKKWVVLTPEEWVRQNMLMYLTVEKAYPRSMMAVEKKVMINGLSQRFDLLIYDRKGSPLVVAEFKAPGVEINQSVLDQVVRYNGTLRAPYVLVSNGLSHFVGLSGAASGNAIYLNEIPGYPDIIGS
jgi:hypothetical protein